MSERSLLRRRAGLTQFSLRGRSFLRFCAERRWTESNPALSLKAPKVTVCPTLPLSREEWNKLLIACRAVSRRLEKPG